jgi:hypothetical protein
MAVGWDPAARWAGSPSQSGCNESTAPGAVRDERECRRAAGVAVVRAEVMAGATVERGAAMDPRPLAVVRARSGLGGALFTSARDVV